MARPSFILSCLALGSCSGDRTANPPAMIVWAWERPEDLRLLPSDVEIAVQTGFIEIIGSDFEARGRGFPLRSAHPPETAMVHLQIDETRPVRWSPMMRGRLVAAVLHYATVLPVRRVQIDFEVRASERVILLDVLRDVRRGLPRGTLLSMTALASWCDGEGWIDAAPVDEIVPMVFRMGRSAETVRRRLAAGGDFADRRCRTAIGIASDEPIARAPTGRRVYIFDPRRWTEPRFAAVRREVGEWR